MNWIKTEFKNNWKLILIAEILTLVAWFVLTGMKLLSILIILYFAAPRAMQSNFIDTNKQANIIITRNNLTVKTTLHHKLDKWTVVNNKLLKTGVNKFYFVLTEKQAINLEVINYE